MLTLGHRVLNKTQWLLRENKRVNFPLRGPSCFSSHQALYCLRLIKLHRIPVLTSFSLRALIDIQQLVIGLSSIVNTVPAKTVSLSLPPLCFPRKTINYIRYENRLISVKTHVCMYHAFDIKPFWRTHFNRIFSISCQIFKQYRYFLCKIFFSADIMSFFMSHWVESWFLRKSFSWYIAYISAMSKWERWHYGLILDLK